jgi:hypothetical protein
MEFIMYYEDTQLIWLRWESREMKKEQEKQEQS